MKNKHAPPVDKTTECNHTLEWDATKSSQNLAKHCLDFVTAVDVFQDFYIEQLDNRKPYGEERYIVLGNLQGREVVLIYTPRGNKKRIISLRKANAREQNIYQQERLKTLGYDG